MSLTNFVFAISILTIVFNGQGFALFDSPSRLFLLEIAIAIGLILLIFRVFGSVIFDLGRSSGSGERSRTACD